MTTPVSPYLSAGDRYRISFSYDTTVPDDVPQPDRGEYFGTLSAKINFSNGFRLKISGGSIAVDTTGTEDYVDFSSEGGTLTSPGVSTAPYLLEGVRWGGVAFDHTLLSSDHLPVSYLPAALFDEAGLATLFVRPTSVVPYREFITQSGTLTSAPLPPALPLFAAAIGGLGLVSWHRRIAQGITA